MASKKMKVGIVGLGIMGGGMATNFLKKGYTVFVWNRTIKNAKRYVKNRAVICSSPAEVAKNSDIVFEVTANDKSSKNVWLGRNGILSGADQSKVLIACATLSIEWTDRLIKECAKRSFTFLDAPLTGGRVGAEGGNLTMLFGGKESDLRKIKPTLKAIAGKVIHFGPVGHGMRYKLILNFLQAIHVIVLGEGLKIAKTNKMNLKKVGNALAEKPGGLVTKLGWRDYQKDPRPINFSIEWIAKDLSYAKKFAKEMNISFLDEALRRYKKAIKNGYSQKDWASINKLS